MTGGSDVVFFARQHYSAAEVVGLAAIVVADEANLDAIEDRVREWEAGQGSVEELDRWALAKTGVKVGLLAAGHEVDQ